MICFCALRHQRTTGIPTEKFTHVQVFFIESEQLSFDLGSVHGALRFFFFFFKNNIMGWSSTGIEVYYTPSSAHCRALLMCIKALELDVELIKIDMYQKFEHRRPWFIKVSRRNFENYLYRLIEVKSSDDQVLKSFRCMILFNKSNSKQGGIV